MRPTPSITSADILDRAAELLADCGWSPNTASDSDGAPYDTFRVIQAAARLLRDEVPDAMIPPAGTARRALKERLGVDSLFEWERDLTEAAVITALREAAAALHAREDRR